jgi:hypothetical protein
MYQMLEMMPEVLINNNPLLIQSRDPEVIKNLYEESYLRKVSSDIDPNIDCEEFLLPIEDGFNVPYVTMSKSNENVMRRGREYNCPFEIDVENIPSLIDTKARLRRF